MIEWSNIEFLLGVLLTRLLRTPEFLGRVYTDEMPSARVQSAIAKALAIHRSRYGCGLISEETLREISSLNTEIARIRGTRNKLSHFCWCRSNDDEIFGSGFSGHVPPSKHIDKDAIVVSLSQLDEMYNESYSVVVRLSRIIAELPDIPEN